MKQQALPFIFLFLSPLPRGNMALPRKGQIDTFILFTQGCAPPPPPTSTQADGIWYLDG